MRVRHSGRQRLHENNSDDTNEPVGNKVHGKYPSWTVFMNSSFHPLSSPGGVKTEIAFLRARESRFFLPARLCDPLKSRPYEYRDNWQWGQAIAHGRWLFLRYVLQSWKDVVFNLESRPQQATSDYVSRQHHHQQQKHHQRHLQSARTLAKDPRVDGIDFPTNSMPRS